MNNVEDIREPVKNCVNDYLAANPKESPEKEGEKK